jgi:hypothetical protein
MASDVEICNRALQKLGAKRITSLTENSVNARACNSAYRSVVDAELEDHDWNFAVQRAELAADSAEPDWGRARSYTLPADFIRLADDYPEDNVNNKDWQIEGKKILSDDTAPIYIRYVYRVTDPNEMTPLFREAVAARMALELCEEITQSNTKKELLKDDYDKIIKKARKSNAFQRVAQDSPEDSWITVRS